MPPGTTLMIDNEKPWSTTSHPLPLETDVENLICKHDKLFNLRQKKPCFIVVRLRQENQADSQL